MPKRESEARQFLSENVIALCKVRGGAWIEGAPTHIFSELVLALERDGWRLARIPPDHPSHPTKQAVRSGEADRAE